MVSDSGCEVRSRAHAGRSYRRPVWPCRRRFNKSNRRLPAGILRLVPRRLCDRATHGSVRRCHCILSKTSLMLPQSLGERLEHLDPGRFGPGDPVLEESLCLGLVRLRPKLPEILLHVVGGRERLVQSQGRNQAALLVSGAIQILGVLQEQPTNPLEDLLLLILSLMEEVASQVRELLVEQLDDMEVIEHD